ncbi:MAG TPA: hypothetical protein VFV19_12225 [Candidatus Polarisedimenticolaceae bacterium]|nr:hypothetical protein [Candidatus Polarisedimenticolaceae bacterium]
MICPVCRDEYRPGFTRCATCDVDLVESQGATPRAKPPAAVIAEVAADEGMTNFCGFMNLEEARAARDSVRASNRRAEIVICEAPGAKLSEPLKEEYWLRVAPKDLRAVAELIGYEPPQPVSTDDDTFNCSACGATVHASDAQCPGCGLSFEE